MTMSGRQVVCHIALGLMSIIVVPAATSAQHYGAVPGAAMGGPYGWPAPPAAAAVPHAGAHGAPYWPAHAVPYAPQVSAHGPHAPYEMAGYRGDPAREGEGGYSGQAAADPYYDFGGSAYELGDSAALAYTAPEQPRGFFSRNARAEGGFFVDAWLSQGFTGNTASPASRFNSPLMFNDRANEYQMNQLYLALGREVATGYDTWDIGGRLDLLYGTDYLFVQSLGLETRRDGRQRWNSSQGPRADLAGNPDSAALYGLAMPQLYAEVYAPVAEGLRVKLGHFYTVLGYESPMAPENFFYSHSYAMQFGEPKTHTGMLASLGLNPHLTIHGGFTRGWDVWEDGNNIISFLGGISRTSWDGRGSLALVVHSGNERRPPDEPGEVGRLDNRTVYSLVWSRQFSDRFTYILQHDLGVESRATLQTPPRNATWYGLNQYFLCDLTETTTLGLRFEWFRDSEHTRVFPIRQLLPVEGQDYFNFTVGLNWRPTTWMTVRPEVRWDWSNVVPPAVGDIEPEGMYNDFQDKMMLTLGGDVIIRF